MFDYNKIPTPEQIREVWKILISAENKMRMSVKYHQIKLGCFTIEFKNCGTHEYLFNAGQKISEKYTSEYRSSKECTDYRAQYDYCKWLENIKKDAIELNKTASFFASFSKSKIIPFAEEIARILKEMHELEGRIYYLTDGDEAYDCDDLFEE